MSPGMTEEPSPPRVVLADDQPLMRAAFRTILESDGIAVVGEAADGAGAVDVTRRVRPDVVLMDVRMPGRDGIDATAEIVAALGGAVKVLVLTTFDEDAALYGALAAGASGFLLKNSTPEDVLQAIRRVAAGDAVLDPTVTGRVFARFVPDPPNEVRKSAADPRALDRLTERERDVLALIAQGLTNAEIADRLGVGEATSKTHVSRVLTKLGVRDRVQAVIYAYETGFAAEDRGL
jgi:DNA-binding NarL/FixJ family response regulator